MRDVLEEEIIEDDMSEEEYQKVLLAIERRRLERDNKSAE